MLRKRFRSCSGPCGCLAVLGVGGIGVEGVVGGMVADNGGTSRSGDTRDGEPAGLAAEEGRGVLAFLDPKSERVEDGGCCDCSGSSEVGLTEMGDL